MFRLGYVTPEQVAKIEKLGPVPPAISYDILNDVSSMPDTIMERVLELTYEKLPAGKATNKRKLTYPGRYAAVDLAIERAIAETFPDDMFLRVHDMAVSNGITAVELFSRISDRSNFSFRASDYYNELKFIDAHGWRAFFDVDGNLMQFVRGRLVIQGSRPEPARYPVNRLLQRLLNATVASAARRKLISGDYNTIPLFHPDCFDLARRDPRFTLGGDNFFDRSPAQYEVIRVMSGFANLAETRAADAISGLARQLSIGGLLVVGENSGRESRETPATIFSRTENGFSILRTLDGGTTFTKLITALKL